MQHSEIKSRLTHGPRLCLSPVRLDGPIEDAWSGQDQRPDALWRETRTGGESHGLASLASLSRSLVRCPETETETTETCGGSAQWPPTVESDRAPTAATQGTAVHQPARVTVP